MKVDYSLPSSQEPTIGLNTDLHIYIYIYIYICVCVCVCVYRYAPHNDVSVNDGSHIGRCSHNIIKYYSNTYHSVAISYNIQCSNKLYRFVAWEQ